MLTLPPTKGDALAIRRHDGAEVAVPIEAMHEGDLALIYLYGQYNYAPLHLDTKTGTYYCPLGQLLPTLCLARS